MAATKKNNYSDIKSESDKATATQVDDIFAQISSLGSTPVTKKTEEPETEEKKPAQTVRKQASDDEEPIIKRSVAKKPVSTQPKEKKANSGYISLVVPEAVKTKWKVFSTEHGLSLTDSIRLGMKLLAEMEQQNMISIEDGVITMNM